MKRENMLQLVTYRKSKSTNTIEDLPFELNQIAGCVEEPTPISPASQYLASREPRQQLPLPLTSGADRSVALKEQSGQAEAQAIISALQASGGQVTRAASLLGISRTTLWRKMAKYGLT